MNQSSGEKTQFVGTEREGSFMQVQHIRCTMNIYPIDESRLDAISTMNGLASLFLSIGGMLIGAGAGIWTNILFLPATPASTPSGADPRGFIYTCMFSLGGCGMLCFGIALFLGFKRQSLVKALKGSGIQPS